MSTRALGLLDNLPEGNLPVILPEVEDLAPPFFFFFTPSALALSCARRSPVGEGAPASGGPVPSPIASFFFFRFF